MDELTRLTPLQEQIIDKSIENINRKLIAGFRNRRIAPSQNEKPGIKTDIKNTLKSSTAGDAMEVANRGSMWKEMIQKSFSHGISSIATLKFDSEFQVHGGKIVSGAEVPKSAGVYVVYDNDGKIRYIGDSNNISKRWTAGHLNEHKQKKTASENYKLAKEFEDGCTVKVINCDSVETAAALEASLIKEVLNSNDHDLVNKKEELKNKQGTRSNTEAKKIKDSLGSKIDITVGAAFEGLKHGGWNVLEVIITQSVIILKEELIDFYKTKKNNFKIRISRLLKRIYEILKQQLLNVKELAKGVFEFILNALSKAISQIYQLAKNIFDLGYAAWSLYKGKDTLSKAELIEKITSTIVLTANTVFWSSIDLSLESALSSFTGPLSPFIAAIISAMGFGITSHYLSSIVPKIVDLIVGYHEETRINLRESAKKIIETSDLNISLVNSLESYSYSTLGLITDIKDHEAILDTVSDRKVIIRSKVSF